MVNKPLIRPYFWGGGYVRGWLNSHKTCNKNKNQVSPLWSIWSFLDLASPGPGELPTKVMKVDMVDQKTVFCRPSPYFWKMCESLKVF